MQIAFCRYFLIIAAVIAMRAHPAIAQSVASSNAETWFDKAVAEVSCPLTPVNVPPGVLQRVSVGMLQKRVSVAGDTLLVKGTLFPDHIVIRPGGATGVVRVEFDGLHLGAFGPVARILVQGRGGGDVMIVETKVGLPARLEGGLGNDCLQGGSGGDQLIGGGGNDVLIAGTGRPALKTGTGSSHIFVPQRMGTIGIFPSAKSELLPLLNKLFTLRAVTQDLGQIPIGTPIVLAPNDLTIAGIAPLLRRTYTAGQSVALLGATEPQAARLRTLLGLPTAVRGLRTGERAPLIFFRQAPRWPGSTASDYSIGILHGSGLSGSLLGANGLREPLIEFLSQVLSKTALVPNPPASPLPAGDPSDDLQQLANSYTSSNIYTRSDVGASVQIINHVWNVRSFPNSADFYYVNQEADFHYSSRTDIDPIFVGYADSALTGVKTTPTLMQPNPASTQCTESTTSGVNFNLGGSAGWNKAQGVNATVTGGITIVHSDTISCPQVKIANSSDFSTGATHWRYDVPSKSVQILPNNSIFYNNWIWEVPFSAYGSGQQTVTIASDIIRCWADVICSPDFAAELTANLNSVVPLPFDGTFSLQQPAVLSVSSKDHPGSTCVAPGTSFYIYGTALYPSLVTSVLINGVAVASGNYTTTSDTVIDVTAPPQTSRTAQPVVVQTQLGQSNSNVAITISATCTSS